MDGRRPNSSGSSSSSSGRHHHQWSRGRADDGDERSNREYTAGTEQLDRKRNHRSSNLDSPPDQQQKRNAERVRERGGVLYPEKKSLSNHSRVREETSHRSADGREEGEVDDRGGGGVGSAAAGVASGIGGKAAAADHGWRNDTASGAVSGSSGAYGDGRCSRSRSPPPRGYDRKERDSRGGRIGREERGRDRDRDRVRDREREADGRDRERERVMDRERERVMDRERERAMREREERLRERERLSRRSEKGTRGREEESDDMPERGRHREDGGDRAGEQQQRHRHHQGNRQNRERYSGYSSAAADHRSAGESRLRDRDREPYLSSSSSSSNRDALRRREERRGGGGGGGSSSNNNTTTQQERQQRRRSSKSSSTSRSRSSMEKSSDSEKEEEEADDSELTANELLQKLMGFEDFSSSKNRDHTSSSAYGVNKKTKRKFRQYMNRKGGFNRPLSPVF